MAPDVSSVKYPWRRGYFAQQVRWWGFWGALVEHLYYLAACVAAIFVIYEVVSK